MKRNRLVLSCIAMLALGLVLAAAAVASAADWPQWRGPDRTGISAEAGWRTDLAANAPKVLWKKNVGQGYSSFSVVGGKVFTMGNADGKDTVFCLDAATGNEVWKQSYPCGEIDYPGTRATPTIDGNRLYVMSQEGDLVCLETDTGKIVWQLKVAKTLGVKKPGWGFACSPLVLGDALIIDVGPIVSLKKADGKVNWKGGSNAPAYGSPFAFKVGQDTLIAGFNASGPMVVSAADGKVVGKSGWKTEYDVNAVTPIVVGNTFFISSGYNRGAAVFEITPAGLKTVWENKNMRNHANNCVLVDGFLYGFDGQVNDGALTCIDYKTGEKKWAEKSVKAGALMVADGKLVCMSSKGELVIAAASPEGFKELGRTKVLGGTCWTTPVLSGGRIFCRNHNGDVVCLDVQGK